MGVSEIVSASAFCSGPPVRLAHELGHVGASRMPSRYPMLLVNPRGATGALEVVVTNPDLLVSRARDSQTMTESGRPRSAASQATGIPADGLGIRCLSSGAVTAYFPSGVLGTS